MLEHWWVVVGSAVPKYIELFGAARAVIVDLARCNVMPLVTPVQIGYSNLFRWKESVVRGNQILTRNVFATGIREI
jgi:hypothetical protein